MVQEPSQYQELVVQEPLQNQEFVANQAMYTNFGYETVLIVPALISVSLFIAGCILHY